MKTKQNRTFGQRPVPTKRLKLIPMSAEELQEAADQEADAQLKKAYAEMRDGVLSRPGQELWHTAWRITRKDTGETIGSIGFRGEPDDKTVGIGCGVSEAHRGHGYATEAVRALCEWAFSKDGVYFVRAAVDDGNIAYTRVLEKLKFKLTGDTEDGRTLWELEKPASSWMAIYMCLGLSVGMSLGMTVFDNSAIGMSIGLALGLTLGISLDAQDKKNRVRKGDKEDEDDSK